MARRAMFLLFIGLFLIASGVEARTWLVSKTDRRGVKSLYEIDFSRLTPGDTVVVRAGVYDQSLRAVNGVRYVARGKVYVNEILAENTFGVTIDGFRLDGKNKSRQTGISVVDSKSVTIRNCRVRDFQEGVSASRSVNVKLDNLLIEDNERGIFLFQSNYITIANSLIAHTPQRGAPRQRRLDPDGKPDPAQDENADFGIEISGGEHVTIDHNTLVHSGATALSANGASRLRFTNNIVAFNGWGLAIESPGERVFEHNVFHKNVHGDQKEPAMPGIPLPLTRGKKFSFDPGFVDADAGDWRLVPEARAAAAGQNGSHLGAFPPLPAQDAD